MQIIFNGQNYIELPLFLLGDFNFDMLADGNNAFNQMSQHAIIPVNVVKNQHIYFSNIERCMY